ncbi:hypothetical protein J4410_05800 [Candidatus Woesearchaeota archaeon]|nr:hypothetical protein [Candidatus Woesearchaeota archaeon]
MLSGKNMPILFAVLLGVGLLEEVIIVALGNLGLPSYQEALIIMLSIALGFGLAVQGIYPFLEKIMFKFRTNFKKRSGILGQIAFYLFVYAALFIAYDMMITGGYFQ